ncbi:Protein of unknown function [Weissella confusa LBAE C39-2]|nr:Protein of unknown function [Weissella confusa LBAE C39-2]
MGPESKFGRQSFLMVGCCR